MARVTVSDLVIALVDLAEAEGRELEQALRRFLASERQALERGLGRAALAAALGAGAVFALLAALCWASWSLYAWLAQGLGPAGAGLCCALLWLAAALVLALLARTSRPAPGPAASAPASPAPSPAPSGHDRPEEDTPAPEPR